VREGEKKKLKLADHRSLGDAGGLQNEPTTAMGPVIDGTDDQAALYGRGPSNT
jgi:hypothetical protein